MRCKSCGTKYDGGMCLKCGTYNAPQKEAPESKKKTTAIAILLGIVVVALFAWLVFQIANGSEDKTAGDDSGNATSVEDSLIEENDDKSVDTPLTEAEPPRIDKATALSQCDEIYSAIVDVDTMYEALPDRLLNLSSEYVNEVYLRLQEDENILNNATLAIYDIDDTGAESVSGSAIKFVMGVDIYRKAILRYIDSGSESSILGDVQNAASDMKTARDHYIEANIEYLMDAGCTETEAKDNLYLGDYE